MAIRSADPWQRYSVLRGIGSGSYGKVYQASDRQLPEGPLVAIKAIRLGEDAAEAEEARAELVREVEFLRRCDSEYVLAFHDAYFHGLDLFLVTALCEAGSLLDVLKAHKRCPLAEREIVAALAGAASALAYLHDEVHVVHRDVKAANLLLTSAGG